MHVHAREGMVGRVFGGGSLRIERRNLLPSQGVVGAVGALVGIGFHKFPGAEVDLFFLAQEFFGDGLRVFLGEIRPFGRLRQCVPEGMQRAVGFQHNRKLFGLRIPEITHPPESPRHAFRVKRVDLRDGEPAPQIFVCHWICGVHKLRGFAKAVWIEAVPA